MEAAASRSWRAKARFQGALFGPHASSAGDRPHWSSADSSARSHLSRLQFLQLRLRKLGRERRCEMEVILHDSVRVHSPIEFPHASAVTPTNERQTPTVAKMLCCRLPR
jgi:hypothetical protein